MTTAKATNGTAPKGLHAKLAEVMAEAKRIPKNGRAPAAMGGFPFVQVGDAADFIREALGKRGVSMLPTAIRITGQNEHATAKGGTMTTVELITTWTLTDGETGDTATLESYGAGADTGDKYSGKAQTNSLKYALLMGWQLSTGDDPELSDSSDRQARAPNADGETLDLIGIDTVSGVIKKGDAQRYQAEWRDMPDGSHVIGFALKRNGDKDLPQVGIMGAVAAGLYATGDFPLGPELIGQKVSLKGRFYGVRQTGRTTYTRVIVGQGAADFIATEDWRIPSPVTDSPLPEEAPSEVLWDADESARIDAAEAAAAR